MPVEAPQPPAAPVAPAKTAAPRFTPWTFLNEGFRTGLIKALTSYQPPGRPCPLQLANATAAAIKEIQSLDPQFNGAAVQIEALANPNYRQFTVRVTGKNLIT